MGGRGDHHYATADRRRSRRAGPLAVDDGFPWYGECASNLGKALGPIQPVAGEHLLSSTVEMDLYAIAVVLDFMKPLVAFGRPGLQRCKLGLNEPRHG